MAKSTYLILSCDGGGIRGLVPALLLQQLDKELDFLKTVDLFAGTSTGGLIALGLASGVPISTLVDIYMTRGAEVFEPYPSLSRAVPQTFKKAYPGAANLPAGLLHPEYTDAGLQKVLRETFPGKPTLADVKRKVLLTAFDLYNADRKSWAPISLTNLPGTKTGDIRVLDAALSTSAGPAYFPPHVFKHKGKKRAFVDGGVYANNPSTLAVATVIARGVLKRRGLAFEDIKLLSLGTGFTLDGMRKLLPAKWYGILAWMSPLALPPTPSFPLLEVLLAGVSDIDTFQCEQILGDNFRRGNVQLTKRVGLGEYKKVKELKKITDDYMASAEWKKIKLWIKRELLSDGSRRKSTVVKKTKPVRRRTK